MARPALGAAAVTLIAAMVLVGQPGLEQEGQPRNAPPPVRPSTAVAPAVPAEAQGPVAAVEQSRLANREATVAGARMRRASVVAVPLMVVTAADAMSIEIEPLTVAAMETPPVALEGIESAPLAIDALPIEELPPLAPIEVE